MAKKPAGSPTGRTTKGTDPNMQVIVPKTPEVAAIKKALQGNPGVAMDALRARGGEKPLSDRGVLADKLAAAHLKYKTPADEDLEVGGTITGRVTSGKSNVEEIDPPSAMPAFMRKAAAEEAAAAEKTAADLGALPDLQTLDSVHAQGAKADDWLKRTVIAARHAIHEMNQHGDRAAHAVQVYIKIRTAVEILSLQMKELGDMVTNLSEVVIPQAFDREKVRTLTTDEGHRVTVSAKLYAAIIAGEKDAAFKWLRKNKHGDLIQEVINAGSLSAWARAEVEAGRPLPTHIFTTHEKTTTSLTRKKL